MLSEQAAGCGTRKKEKDYAQVSEKMRTFAPAFYKKRMSMKKRQA